MGSKTSQNNTEHRVLPSPPALELHGNLSCPDFGFTTCFYGEEHGFVLLAFYGLAENWRCRGGKTTCTCKSPPGFNLLPGVQALQCQPASASLTEHPLWERMEKYFISTARQNRVTGQPCTTFFFAKQEGERLPATAGALLPHQPSQMATDLRGCLIFSWIHIGASLISALILSLAWDQEIGRAHV